MIDESSVESLSEHIRDEDGWDGFMFLTKDNLFVTSWSERNVLKFKLKSSVFFFLKINCNFYI